MVFAKRVFLVAAVYGFLALLPQYFMEDRVGRDFPPAITHAENFYGFLGVALAWQVMFVLISKDPVRYRPAMLVGMLEKVSFGLATVVLFLQGRLSPVVLAAGCVDLLFAGLFVVAFLRTEPAKTP